LPPNVARALDAMIGGATDAEIARELECDRVTVWRWRHRPDVAGVLAAARAERLHEVAGRLRDAAPRALDLLVRILDDDDAPVSVRVKAAGEILDRAGFTSKGVLGVQRDAEHDAGPPSEIDVMLGREKPKPPTLREAMHTLTRSYRREDE
jgi:hypothetical protein